MKRLLQLNELTGAEDQLCPVCDAPILELSPAKLLIAHGLKYITHAACFDQLQQRAPDLQEGSL